MDYSNYQPPVLVYIIAFVLAIHMYTFPFIVYPELTADGPSWLGLDVSWQMTLNYANIQDWVWGKDIVFTYGPLGFLATRIGWGVSRWTFLLFDLFMIVNFFYIFKDFLKASTNKFVGVFILLATTLTLNMMHGTDLSLLLLAFSFYWIYKSYANPTPSSLVWLGLIVIIAFYVKMNTGLLVILLFLTHIMLMYFLNKISLKSGLISLGVLTLGLVGSAWLLNVSLPGYIHGSFELIKGYNSSMYLDDGNTGAENNIALVYTLIKYLFIAFAIYLFLKGKLVQFFFLAIGIGYVLLLKKQALIRGDIQHLSEFFCYVPLVLIYGNLVHHRDTIQKYFSAVMLAIVLLCLFFKTDMLNKQVDNLFLERFSTKQAYIEQFINADSDAYANQKNKKYIPERILNTIGNATVDIFPWDISYLIENNLNYKPRPIIQSYSAYTQYLQQLNYDSYINDGPEYIIYDYESIDRRYPFGDETKLSMLIVKNYSIADSFESNGRSRLLLKKRSDAIKPLNIELVETRTFDIKDRFPIVEGTNMVKVHVKYHSAGRKAAMLDRPPAIDLCVYISNGHEFVYKTSMELLKAGQKSDKMVVTLKDLVTLLVSEEDLDSITSMSLSLNRDFFDPEITVEYYKVK